MAKAKKKTPAKRGTMRTDEQLKKFVKMYEATGGNRSEAARRLGIHRMTFNDALKEAELRFGIKLGRVADGRIEQVQNETRPMPAAEHEVKRYIFTSVQNNTHLHPGWLNLKAYADWLDGLEHSSCEFIVGTYSYAIDAYGAKAVKRNTWKPDSEGPWYAPDILDYIQDQRIELAPGLVWCGEMNILPTTRRPLSGLETYNGRKSNIVPHATVAMESVPSMPGEGTKMNWTTGTITQRNYIQKSAGIKAEPWHSYGGLLVEVNYRGDWYVRQLHIDGNGAVYDVGPSEHVPVGHVVKAWGGEVNFVRQAVEAITWGDIHTAEMEPWVRELGWGHTTDEPSLIDTLRPRKQICHDIFSMRSRGHHEMKDFHAMYSKMVAGQDSVEKEVRECAEFLSFAERRWCETIVVPSNHDRHLTRWLKEEDPRKDPKNAKYHMRLQHALLDSIDQQDGTFNILEWALRDKGCPKRVRFLREDESYVLCAGSSEGGIESGLHGDLGSGGARGSTQGLTRLGRAVTKGHDHTAAIRDNVYSVGACQLRFPYMKGPSAHSVTHVVTFENGRRQMLTMWEGRWRA